MKHVPENLFIVPAYHRALGYLRLREEFPGEHFTELSLEELAADFGNYIRRFQRYRRAVFFTYDLETAPRIALWSALLSWIGRRSMVLDASGRKRRGSLILLVMRDVPRIANETVRLPFLLRRVKKDLAFIGKKKPAPCPDHLSIAYLRTDHWFGINSGGSVAHIAGVANSFRDLGVPVFLISSDCLELIDEATTPLFRIEPRSVIQNLQGGAEMAYNQRLIESGTGILAERKPTLIYQRYSPYNYAGAYFATACQLPFVLEYNGSEIWIAEHWGTPTRFSKWGAEIELANLQAADAIVVVSQALKDELVERGLSADKILVNPNGVDASRFDPDLIHDKSRKLRKTLGLEDKIVVGFIATFGRWHGAEILARAIRPVIEKDPRIHFLFIGDGATVAAVRNIVRDTHATAATTFTGMIHQKDGPLYLGACDMFVCPHIPNPDGTPFFGSPIKLFEYMAMARGIVASRLDQIAQVLKHRTTALLVTPGSVAELVDGILELAAKPDERTRLGSNARQEVVARYTWVGHTARILDHVRDVLRRNNGL